MQHTENMVQLFESLTEEDTDCVLNAILENISRTHQVS